MNENIIGEPIFIDGDFPSGQGCKYHCSPTCHPGQIGPEWHYGCTHKAWPQNRFDFCPFVECGGQVAKCEIPERFLKNIIRGKRRQITNVLEKIARVEEEISELEYLESRGGTSEAGES